MQQIAAQYIVIFSLPPPPTGMGERIETNKQTKKTNVEHTAEIKLFTKTKEKDNNYDIYILCMML